MGTETVKTIQTEFSSSYEIPAESGDSDLPEPPTMVFVPSTGAQDLDVQTFPSGTVLTVGTRGYGVDSMTRERFDYTTVYVSQYNLQGELTNEYTTKIEDFSLVLSDSNSYYCLYSDVSGLEDAPVWESDRWYVKAANTGAMPAPSTPSIPEPTPTTSSAPANNVGDTYKDEHIQVTNVTSTGKGQYTVDVEDHPEESWPEITCNAPVEVTLDASKAYLMEYAPIETYWDSRESVTDGKITLTQPGTYIVGLKNKPCKWF